MTKAALAAAGAVALAALSGVAGCDSDSSPKNSGGTPMYAAHETRPSESADWVWLPILHGNPLVPASGLEPLTAGAGDRAFQRISRTRNRATFRVPDTPRIDGIRLVARLRRARDVFDPVVDLGSQATDRRLALVKGWAAPGETQAGQPVRWALKPQTSIAFTLDAPTDVRVHFALPPEPWCFRGKALSLRVNGHDLGRYDAATVRAPGGFHFVIPEAVLKEGRNFLNLYHEGVPPRPDNDPRELAVLFKGIVLRPDDGALSIMPGLAEDRGALGPGWQEPQWDAGRPVAWAVGPRSELTIRNLSAARRDLKVRCREISVDGLNVELNGQPLGTLRASDLLSSSGATLSIPANIPLTEELRLAFVPQTDSSVAPDRRIAKIEWIRFAEPPLETPADTATKLLVQDQNGVRAEVEVRGVNWRAYEVPFSGTTARLQDTELTLTAGLKGFSIEIANMSVRTPAAERMVRTVAPQYPIEFGERTAHKFYEHLRGVGRDRRRAMPLAPGRTLAYRLSRSANHQPTLWISARALVKPARLSVRVKRSGSTQEIKSVALEPAAGANAAFRPVFLDLREYADDSVDLHFTFDVVEPVSTLDPPPVLFLSLADARPLPAGQDDLPNIILISIDTFRADYLSCYGGSHNLSPRLDRFATEEATLFENCRAATPWTLPSHVAMLFGDQPAKLGLYHDLSGARGRQLSQSTLEPFGHLKEGVVSLAGQLGAAGYERQAFTDNGYAGAHYGFGRGFDSYVEAPAVDARGTVEYTLEFLRARRSERPAFLFVHSYDVHAPYTHTEVLRERGLMPAAQIDELEARIREGEYLDTTSVSSILREMGSFNVEVTRALYQGGIRYADAALGYFFDELKKMGMWDDTLIIVTSDHGEEFGERDPKHIYDMHAQHLYPELIHVPMIVKWPRSRFAGQRIDTIVGHLDIAPTALAAAGVQPRVALPGMNLMELVTADSRPVRTVFSGCLKDNLPEVQALRRGRYAVLSPMLRDPVFYDLQDDPTARSPLAADAVPDSAAMLEALRGFTLRGLNGEIVFWYRNAQPIDRLRLSIRHAHAPLAVFPYDGLARQELHCGPQETSARFQHEPGTGPTQIVFALVAPEPMALEVRLEVNGQPVSHSQLRIGVNGSAPDGAFDSGSTVVPLNALGLLRLPDAGELCVFAVESLTSKMGGGQTGSDIVDEAQRAALRALGYIDDEEE